MQRSTQSRRLTVVTTIAIACLCIAVAIGLVHPFGNATSDWIATAFLAMAFIVAACARVMYD